MKIFYSCIVLLVFSSCSVHKKIAAVAKKELLRDSVLIPAHLGIAVYDASAQKFIYEYHGNKYFVPASNTKLFSLYAGLKYLGDSLPGIKYYETKDTLYVQPTGDPVLLHPDFKLQRVANFLKEKAKPVVILTQNWRTEPLGYGWAWDDYNDSYMAERSALPVYGNVIRWQQYINDKNDVVIQSTPFLHLKNMTVTDPANKRFEVKRDRDDNFFHIYQGTEKRAEQEVPYVTKGIETARLFLADSLKLAISTADQLPFTNLKLSSVYSVPADSMYILMMHRSDNFFAEQTLLMASNEKLGMMNEGDMISYLLKNDLNEIPQKPKWVDGSGLSRYNLFTPEAFVWILNKLKNEFGLERMKKILPTGGEGTLRNLYSRAKGYIFAKTGTLSNNTSLSGYLLTQKNKLLIFSFQANNFQTGSTPVRLAFERFIMYLHDNY